MYFFESNICTGHQRGSIEVICGSMFSGKTEELLRRLKRAKIAKQKVEIFKPCIDTRYSETEVVSHDNNAIISTPVESSQNILLMAGDVDVIGIDEAQFFDSGITDVFGPMPALMAIADDVTKEHAVCVRCGAPAYISHRTVAGEKQVLLGETDKYEPICRCCYSKEKQKGKKD